MRPLDAWLQLLTVDHPAMTTTEFWTSHECLLLPHEQSLTRLDSTSGRYYDCSAHFIWVEERAEQLDGARVEFMRRVANPLGILERSHPGSSSGNGWPERDRKHRWIPDRYI